MDDRQPDPALPANPSPSPEGAPFAPPVAEAAQPPSPAPGMPSAALSPTPSEVSPPPLPAAALGAGGAPPQVPPPLGPVPPRLPLPAPPRKVSTGRGWKVLAIVLLAVVGLGMMLYWVTLSRTFMAAGQVNHKRTDLQELVVDEASGTTDKIAVIDVEGIIVGDMVDGSGWTLPELIAEQLTMAADDDDVCAVVLKVNSPGGEVLASDDIYNAIAAFQESSEKPVVAAMGAMAASGGYYVSAACQWIVANELTITGSIGVILHGYNYRGLFDKIGVRPEVYKSGRFKDMLSGDRAPDEVSAEERAMVQGLVMETYDKFTNVVAEGRGWAAKANQGQGKALSPDWTAHVDGRVLSGRQAHALGFVDELGNFDVAVDRALELAGVSDASLIRYEQPLNFGHLLRMFGKSDASTLKVDLGLDFPRLQIGRLYYLAPLVLP